MNIEWEVEHQLLCKFGTLDFNVTDMSGTPPSGLRYQIMPSGYRIGPTLRVTNDNLSQFDGSDLHPRWLSGTTATITVRYQQNTGGPDGTDYLDPCTDDRVDLDDRLRMWLNALRTLTWSDNQRLLWFGSGGRNRMLTDIELLAVAEPTFGDAGEVTVSFALESPFPYAIDQTQRTITGHTDGTFTVSNLGTADTYPVYKIHPVGGTPVTQWSLINNTSGETLAFDSTRPGGSAITAGHYLEIDTFRGTAFLDGSGADDIAAIDPIDSDFFPLYALDGASNSLTFFSTALAKIDILWNYAWA